MQLWRINLKPDSQLGIDSADFCITRGVVGIGWAVPGNPATKEEYRQMALQNSDLSSGWTRAANAVLDWMSVGDLIWSRNQHGTYILGQIDGDWRYESGDEFRAADLVNLRPCTWTRVGEMDKVPGAVVNSFRPSATVQRVNDPSSLIYSQFLYATQTGRGSLHVDPNASSDILSLISTDDLEDAVAVYLQKSKNCLMLPSTCKRDTPVIECMFVDADTGQRIGMQVKSGSTPLNKDDYTNFDGLVYLFAASGNYFGQPNLKCDCIPPDTIRLFIYEHRRLMPGTVQTWLDFVEAQHCS